MYSKHLSFEFFYSKTIEREYVHISLLFSRIMDVLLYEINLSYLPLCGKEIERRHSIKLVNFDSGGRIFSFLPPIYSLMYGSIPNFQRIESSPVLLTHSCRNMHLTDMSFSSVRSKSLVLFEFC